MTTKAVSTARAWTLLADLFCLPLWPLPHHAYAAPNTNASGNDASTASGEGRQRGRRRQEATCTTKADQPNLDPAPAVAMTKLANVGPCRVARLGRSLGSGIRGRCQRSVRSVPSAGRGCDHHPATATWRRTEGLAHLLNAGPGPGAPSRPPPCPSGKPSGKMGGDTEPQKAPGRLGVRPLGERRSWTAPSPTTSGR